MSDWEKAKTTKAKLKVLFRWINENDNSAHEKRGDTQKMTPKELVEIYGTQILARIGKP